jgi:hypothetical protein
LWDTCKECQLLKDAAAALQLKLLRASVGAPKRPGALGETRDTKRQATHKELVDRKASRDGDIIFAGADNERMPLPKITNEKERPCAPHYRKGQACKRGDDCRYCHKSINDLSPETQKEWWAHVNATESLSFNTKRVKGVASFGSGDKKPAATE